MATARRAKPLLDRAQLGVALAKLSRSRHPAARDLYVKVARAYGHRPDRDFVQLAQLAPVERALLHRAVPAALVSSYRYVAVYYHAKLEREVVVKTNTRPPKRRSFRVAGSGLRKFTRTKLTDTTKESTMARSKTKTEDIEEIEGLEDVEDLEDLEDTDIEEPDAEDQSNGELDNKTLKELRAMAKEAGIKGASKLGKDALIEQLGGEDEEEDDSDEFDEMDRTQLKRHIKANDLEVRVTKSMSEDDIRTAIREADEEEDEPEEKPKRSRSRKGKAEPAKADKKKGRTPPTPPNRELPKGKVGAERIAELAGVDSRAVRIYLRGQDNVEQYKTEGRWAFTEKQAQTMAKQLKKAKG